MSDDIPPPQWVKPDYAEREDRPRKNLARTKTSDISMDDIRRELKARKRQQPWKLAIQTIAALGAFVVAVTGLWKAVAAVGHAEGAKAVHDADQVLIEYRLTQEENARHQLELDVATEQARIDKDHADDFEKLRDKLEELRVRQSVCCARKRGGDL